MQPIQDVREVALFQEWTGSKLPPPLTKLILQYLCSMKDMQTCVKLGLQERFWEVFVEGSCFTGRFLKVALTDVCEEAIFMRHVTHKVRTELGTFLKGYTAYQKVGQEGCSDSLPLRWMQPSGDCFCVWNRSETSMQKIMQLQQKDGEDPIHGFRFSDDKTRIVLKRVKSKRAGRDNWYTKSYHYYVYDIHGNRLVLAEDNKYRLHVYVVGNNIFIFDLAKRTCTRFSVDDALRVTATTQAKIEGYGDDPAFFHQNSLKFYYVEKFYYGDSFLKGHRIRYLDCQSLTSHSLNLEFYVVYGIHVQGDILAVSGQDLQKKAYGVFLYRLSNLNEGATPFSTISFSDVPGQVKLYRDRLYVDTSNGRLEFVKDSRG